MPRRRILPPIKPLIISLAVTAAILLVVGVLFAPDLVRFVQDQRRLARLTAENPPGDELRETLDSIARRADERPGFRAEVTELLPRLDDARFTAVSAALDHAGVWSRRYVPDAAWIRSLGDLADSPTPAGRIRAAQSLADLTDIPDHPRVHKLLERLADDESEDVRLNALSPLGRLGATANDPGPYVNLLFERTEDENQAVAMHAWLVLGWLRPSPETLPRETLIGRVGQAPPAVLATAQAWSVARIAPEAAERALRPWRIGEDEPLRLAARYALEPDALAKAWNVDAPAIELPEDREQAVRKLRRLLSHSDARVREVAAVVAMETLDATGVLELSRSLLLSLDDDGQLGGALLAGLADLRPAGIRRGDADADGERDARPLSELLALSDDQLAALGHERVDLLSFHYREADDWVEKRLYGLALWMRGETPADFRGEAADYAAFARNLLIREDVPRTAVLLALMDAGHPTAALEWLLNPMGQPPLPLDPLLNEFRWHRVLQRYLPDTAPPVWRQAPPLIRNLQLNALRDWALVALAHEPTG